MHDSKGFVIVATIAGVAFGSPASAQQDAAQKATEGSIDHWIEYYRGQQSKSIAPPRQETVANPTPPESANSVRAREPGEPAASATPK